MTNLLSKTSEAIKNIVWDKEFETASLWAAVNLVGWGIWFSMPWDMRQLGRVYIIFENILPENIWAIVFISLGLFRVFILAVDHYHDVLKWQIGGLLASTFLWTFSLAVYFQSEPRSMLVYITSFLSLTSLWELIRVIRKLKVRKEIKNGRPSVKI